MPSPHYDIAIIGAGPAGIAAASAAAERGAHVLLIEATTCLGGSVVAAMHRSLCGLYSRTPDSPIDTLNAGSQRDLVRHLLDLAPEQVHAKSLGKTVVLEFPSVAYEAALLKLIEKPNIDRRMNTRLTGVHREGNRITAIQIGSVWITAKSLIDCTGSGALLQMVGDDVMQPPDENRMLGGFSIRLSNITGDPEMLRLQLPYVLAKAVLAGRLPTDAKLAMFHPGPGPGEGVCKLAIRPEDFAGEQSQKLANDIIKILRQNLPAFAEATIAEMSSRALPRDGRRLLGRATVDGQAVLIARQIGPEAVHAWWPIEHWQIDRGPIYSYPPIGRHYDIPIDAMRSAVIDNLFAAGLCVSATATAAASLRASGICLATGHAAGTAAVAWGYRP
jgi:glycine/D-amino acid oxidase-like deaminating enzyme